MISEEFLLQKIKVLPPDLKQKAIEFVESLQSEVRTTQKKKGLKGMLAHLNIKITEEDIREARNEMWHGYTEDTENDK